MSPNIKIRTRSGGGLSVPTKPINTEKSVADRLAKPLVVAVSLLTLAGCATRPGNPNGVPAAKRDPLAPINRQIYRFNSLLDSAVLKPLAKGYVKITPQPVRHSITNFFSNLTLPVTIANDLLQLKPLDAVRDTGRFLADSTVGIGGLFTPASSWGMPAHEETLGTTMARWGVPSGPYLVLPILGPSTLRSAVGSYFDSFASPLYGGTIRPAARNPLVLLQGVEVRAKYLSYDQMLEQAYDPYALIRNTFLENLDEEIRKNLPNYNPNQLPNYKKLLKGSGNR